jgi:hypothetical protein
MALPPGFVLEQPKQSTLPPGFVLEQPTPETIFEGNIRKLKNTGLGAVRSGMKVASVAQGLIGDKKDAEEKLRQWDEYFARQADTSSPDYKGGELLGDIAITAPLGGMIAAPLKGLATVAPKVAPTLNLLADALSSGGVTKTKATSILVDYATRITGAAGLGAITSGVLGGDTKDVLTSAGISALIPGAVQPAGKFIYEHGKQIFTPAYNALTTAIGSKGQEIINALRASGQELVPGSMPTASQAAANVGQAEFSGLSRAVAPFAASENAALQTATNEARLAHKARVGAVIAKDQEALTNSIADVSPRETGQKIIELGKKERENLKKTVVTPAYTAAFKEAGNAKVNVDTVVSEAEKILERKLSDFRPETAPNTVRLLNTFKPAPVTKTVYSPATMRSTDELVQPPAEATLQQLDDLRKAINADIAVASRSMNPTTDTALYNLKALHKTVDDAVKQSTTLSAKAKDLYAEALNKYRTVYVPKAKTGVNQQLFKQTTLNEPKLEPDNVIKTYFQPKGEREASQFVELFGTNPEAKAAAAKGIENLYRENVVNAAGIVDPARHAKFMKDYARPLAIFDSAGLKLTPKLSAIGDKATALAAKEALIPTIKPLSSTMYADKIRAAIATKTKSFTPQQQTDINALADDMAREMEDLRLASFVPKSDVVSAPSAQLPGFLSNVATVYNAAMRRLQGKMNDAAAKELAITMLKPYATADLIEKAIASKAATEATRASTAKALKPVAKLVAPIVTRNALAPQQQNQNALANQ